MTDRARTANEAAALRAAAREVVGRTPYESEVARAVDATLDWLEGVTEIAPVTGEPVAPSDAMQARERLRAIDVEDRALRSRVDGTYPGCVAQTLSWYARRPYAEAPL